MFSAFQICRVLCCDVLTACWCCFTAELRVAWNFRNGNVHNPSNLIYVAKHALRLIASEHGIPHDCVDVDSQPWVLQYILIPHDRKALQRNHSLNPLECVTVTLWFCASAVWKRQWIRQTVYLTTFPATLFRPLRLALLPMRCHFCHPLSQWLNESAVQLVQVLIAPLSQAPVLHLDRKR